ncbi:hypothetical protein MKW94_016432 [Papaver nudicaule]|uniref:Plastocyanin-like domain-containing protein n=1 Tax=Papaver nudicaule TaxID=74823 RepID=A0AA42B044_PAPNU|nr:hypothetical protein [Papaver nudicaule]
MGRQLWFAPFVYVLIITLACSSSVIYAKIVEHTFHVKRTVIAVNGSFPGPTIRVNEGDTLIVHVFNKSPYDLFSAWADGPVYATQCPIKPGNKYTYKFQVTKQEGTLWWHAHTSYMRATVYGALIIRPRQGRKYPFPKPYREVPLMLGMFFFLFIFPCSNSLSVKTESGPLHGEFSRGVVECQRDGCGGNRYDHWWCPKYLRCLLNQRSPW